MKIIVTYILTNLKEHKTRTGVMLLSILLSAMLLFVSFSIGQSYESAQRKMARGMAGSATVSIRAVSGSIEVSEIPDLPSIRSKTGLLTATSIYKDSGYYETIDLIAADLDALNEINKPRLQNGSTLSGFLGSQIILPDRFTSKYGIKKGDMITLYLGGAPVNLKVGEIAAYDTVFLRHTRGATALLPLETLSQLLGQTHGYSQILVEPAEGTTPPDLISELLASLDHDRFQITQIVNERQIAADARQKSMPFFLISFYSLTMSIFIIYSSYKVITLDRLPIIGAFRSIGATEKTVTLLLLLESWFYGLTGGLLAIPAGMAVLKIILQGMGQSLAQGIEIPVIISAPGVLLSLAVAMAVSLLSAWLPVRRACRLPIKEVVLGTVSENRVSSPFVMAAGMVLFIISAWLPKLVKGPMLYLLGGFSLLGLIAAAILMIPAITNLAGAGLEQLYARLFKNEGRLAARNLKDNKNVTQNITLLFISISAMIAISVVGSFVTAYISDVFHGAELEGFADGHMEPEFTDVEAVIPASYAVSDLGARAYDFLAYTAADPDAVMVQIRNLFGETSNWSRTVEEFNSDALLTVGAFLKPMHSMTYLILLLAAIGVINHLLINYIQKRRIIAVYKSIGMSNQQHIKMTLIEGFTAGFLGASIAIFVSYMEIQTIFLVAGPKISMTPELNPKTFLMAGALGIFVTLFGSAAPIFKSLKMNLVEEIKFE